MEAVLSLGAAVASTWKTGRSPLMRVGAMDVVVSGCGGSKTTGVFVTWGGNGVVGAR